MDNRSEEDHKLSQGRYGPERHQEGLGKPNLCEAGQETEGGQVELVDGLEEPGELSMAAGEGDTGLVFLNGKDIFSLKTEELKAELDSPFHMGVIWESPPPSGGIILNLTWSFRQIKSTTSSRKNHRKLPTRS